MKESTTPASTPQYIKVPAIAKKFSVHPRTVWDWVYRGLLPHRRIGRNIFFVWEEVEKVMNENRYVGYERVPLESLVQTDQGLVPKQMDLELFQEPASPKFRRTW